jgi:glycosyltransferase involved in cell wall biosynthesis
MGNPAIELSVIIPVFNEKASVRELITQVAASPVNKEILVVDDFSSDGTRDILKEFENAQLGCPIRIFYQEHNQGKGAAIRRAQPEARGQVTIIQDADLECNPKDYPAIIEPILSDYADVVYGSRFHTGKRIVASFRHAMGNKILTYFSNIFTDMDLRDMETCYKAFKTPLFQSIPIRSNRFDFEPEITAKIAKRKVRIVEVPISYQARWYDQGKKIGFRDALRAIVVILKYSLIDDSRVS